MAFGVVGLAGKTSGMFLACGPVYVRSALGRCGGTSREDDEDDVDVVDADDEELVLITDTFRLSELASMSTSTSVSARASDSSTVRVPSAPESVSLDVIVSFPILFSSLGVSGWVPVVNVDG